MQPWKYAGFLFPVIDGIIYLGKRGTPPYEGMWGAIGGKAEKTTKPGLITTPIPITKPGGHIDISVFDRIAMNEGRELVLETCVRECFEELFSDKKYPDDFAPHDVMAAAFLGFVIDLDKQGNEHECNFGIASVTRHDFFPSPRELIGFAPLSEIDPETIFPISRIPLVEIKYLWENGMHKYGRCASLSMYNLGAQIPYIHLERRFTSMFGAAMEMSEQGLLR